MAKSPENHKLKRVERFLNGRLKQVRDATVTIPYEVTNSDIELANTVTEIVADTLNKYPDVKEFRVTQDDKSLDFIAHPVLFGG